MNTFWNPEKPNTERRIAYFSMEVGIDPRIPTYSGGLGVLAGDTLKACADLRVPTIGVTLLSEKGYFFQTISSDGHQQEREHNWAFNDFMQLIPVTVNVEVEGRQIALRAWEHVITSAQGFQLPVYFLDSNVESNREDDRALTSYLYGGDSRYRLLQEIILGIGGMRMLKALGYNGLQRYHMNEGHSSFLILELLKTHQISQSGSVEEKYDVQGIRQKCVFTTHTPIPAGHDRFTRQLAESVFQSYFPLEDLANCFYEDCLHTTLLALNYSNYVNGVAKKHGEVTRKMFTGFQIDSITNGVHSATWTADSFKNLYDRHIPGWRNDPHAFRHALAISEDSIWQAHEIAKKQMIDYVNERSNAGLDYDVFTIGFARRSTAYKRPTLVFRDLERLLHINKNAGAIQIVFAGKSHPHDGAGKQLISEIHRKIVELRGRVNIAFVENYDMDIAARIVTGVDLWLNTPLPPLEASGTSGMKAAHNGIPSLSILDGWWLEGHLEGVTGWAIGSGTEDSSDDSDAADLYMKLERDILPLYYKDRSRWIHVMRNCIALNASFFNTHRMVHQYVLNAYFDTKR